MQYEYKGLITSEHLHFYSKYSMQSKKMITISNRLFTSPHLLRYPLKPKQSTDFLSSIPFLVSNTRKHYQHEKDSHNKLSQEIKRTNSRLRIRRFKQKISPQNEKNIQNSQNLDVGNEISDNRSICQSRSFSQFMRKKKTENVYMANRMKIFGNTLTERSKAKVQYQINDLLNKNINSANTDSFMSKRDIQKMKKYLICHKILENLFELIVQNPKWISLKTQFPEIYMNLKKQMVEAIIDLESMDEVNIKIEQQIKAMKAQKFDFSTKKLMQMSRKNRAFYTLKEKKKDLLSETIEKQFQNLKNIVQDAIQTFNSKRLQSKTYKKWLIDGELKNLDEETRIQ